MSKPTKTIREWIKGIEDQEIRRKIMNRADKVSLDDPAPDLASAISGAFSWADSKEGFSYWANIVDDLTDFEALEVTASEFDLDQLQHD